MSVIGKLRKGQVTILGKAIPIFVIATLLMSGTVAALLTVYITISGTATVTQSVILTDIMTSWMDDTATSSVTADNAGEYDFDTMAGGIQDVGLKIYNQASIDATVDFVPIVTGDGVLDVDVMITFYDGFDEITEQCDGSEIPPTDVVIAAGNEQWYCARHEFTVDANPGDYIFTITVEPS